MTDPSEEPMYPPEKAQLQAGLLHGCRRCLLFDEKTSENPNRKDTGEDSSGISLYHRSSGDLPHWDSCQAGGV